MCGESFSPCMFKILCVIFYTLTMMHLDSEAFVIVSSGFIVDFSDVQDKNGHHLGKTAAIVSSSIILPFPSACYLSNSWCVCVCLLIPCGSLDHLHSFPLLAFTRLGRNDGNRDEENATELTEGTLKSAASLLKCFSYW